MRNAFILIFIMHSCSQSSTDVTRKFSIDIWNYDYSMAYTTHYKIKNDSIIVTGISGVQNEENKTLLSRAISKNEKKNLYDFLSSFPLDSLATEYKNPLVEDGDQKRIEIVFNDKKKTINIENFYQKDLGNLFNVVNQVLEKDMQIKYRK